MPPSGSSGVTATASPFGPVRIALGGARLPTTLKTAVGWPPAIAKLPNVGGPAWRSQFADHPAPTLHELAKMCGNPAPQP